MILDIVVDQNQIIDSLVAHLKIMVCYSLLLNYLMIKSLILMKF